MIFNPVVQGGGGESVFEPDGNNSFRFQKTSPVGTVDVAYQDVSGIEKTFNLAYAGTKTVNDWCPGNEMTITIMDTSGHSVANLIVKWVVSTFPTHSERFYFVLTVDPSVDS